jgi:two-component system chemotaxis response regulator CheB
MDGITTLKHLMIKHPIPTVMLSSLSRDGAKITFDALRYGAVDFITKPSHLNPEQMLAQSENMIKVVKSAALVEMDVMQYIRPEAGLNTSKQDGHFKAIVAMGAAEGGYNSLLNILPRLSANVPLVYIVVLYGASRYIDSFIAYLNQYSSIAVQRAIDGCLLQSGSCYIATGEEYVTLNSSSAGRTLQINPAPFESQHNTINRLMFSLALHIEQASVGIILSGTGRDGSEGLEELQRIGEQVMVLDPKNCLHKTMAKSALNRCAMDKGSSVAEIVANLDAWVK